LSFSTRFNNVLISIASSLCGDDFAKTILRKFLVGGAWWHTTYKAIYVSDNFVSLDIAGHEYSHGVHLALGKLTTNTGETGALAEATGDIFGTCSEYFANNPNDPGDWLIAEKVGSAIRDMQKPSNKGGYDFYDISLANAEPHAGAGVGDHFFYYLLYGVPTSGFNFSPYLPAGMTGMGSGATARNNAAKIWYRALRFYMTGSSVYNGARLATLNAADDLEYSGTIPTGTRTKIKNAWRAVNIPVQLNEDDFCKTCQ